MGRTKLRDIVAEGDLEGVEVKPRQKTGIHKKGRDAFMSQIANNPDLEQAAEQGVYEITVSVDDCRLWPYNDRIYDSLSMENCKSLVEDIQKNTQLQPVVARKDPTGRKNYEIIIGTRRFWACQHTAAKTINIALIDADDKQAYKIMRSENQERDDTTAYEKAMNAKRVIAEIYAGSQKSYCLENDIGEGTLSNWMAIADMEPELVAVIPSMFEVSVKQATKLRSVMNKAAKSKKAVLDKVSELAGAEMGTAAVMKALIKAGEDANRRKVRGPVEKAYVIGGDSQGVVVKEAASGALTIKVSKAASADSAAVIKALSKHFG
jgi:ParB/RepB/Spo0J family partition protein